MEPVTPPRAARPSTPPAPRRAAARDRDRDLSPSRAPATPARRTRADTPPPAPTKPRDRPGHWPVAPFACARKLVFD